jgi:hypothetical protein
MKTFKLPNIYHILIIFLSLLGFTACDIKDSKEVNPTLSFTKIYDNELFTKKFTPLDIKQTADGGYIVLAETALDNSTFPGIFLLQTDSAGNYKASQTLDAEYVNVASDLFVLNGALHFVCMSSSSSEAKLVRVGGAGVTDVQQFTGITFPLSAQLSGNEIVIQFYNQDEFATYVATTSPASSTPTSLLSFPVVIDGYNEFKIEKAVFDHIRRIGKKKPFLSGAAGGGIYYYNGYLEETFSLVFFNFSEDYAYGPEGGNEPSKLLGVNDTEVISSLLQIGNSRKFSISRYVNGENFFTPISQDFDFATNAVITSSSLTSLPIPELFPDARVVLKRIQVNGRNILLYASDTKSKQIILFAYDEASGNLLGKKYLGSGFPYEIGGFVQTADKGLAVVGTAYLTGRFPRVCIFKLTEGDLNSFIKQAATE